MESRGQTRHAPNSKKQATTSSAAFIGWRNYISAGASAALRRWAKEAAQHEVLEARFELFGDLPGHFLGGAGPLGLRAGRPALEIGVAVRGPFPHGHRVDQILEALRERHP